MKRLFFILPAVMLAALLAAGRADDPRDAGTTTTDAAQWWSYQALERPVTPDIRGEWASNPIDTFIAARLSRHDLSPAPRASRRTLIRRAYYDLTGLPPTPEEVEAFVADDSPDAWEAVIDRLLASPHYGERWGRHWLDLVRYAETDSYERDRTKPGAWRYRDYVIRSLNEDKPCDQFITEQLAGDEIEPPTLETIIATGYYRLGIWDDEPTDVLQAQYDDLDSILRTTSEVMLATTIGCARCHDHKGDPIPQRDYYRMLAFFENIKPYKVGGGNNVNAENFVRHVPADLGSNDFEQALDRYEQQRQEVIDRATDIAKRAIGSELGDSVDSGSRITDGLVAHLTFDQDDEATARDRIGSFNGIGRGPTLIDGGAPCSLTHARHFDGVDDYIEIDRPVQNSFTIAFWFRTETFGSGGADYRWFLGDGLVDGEVRGIVPDFGISHHSNGRITAGIGEPETFLVSPPGFNDGAWHHVALARDMDTGRVTLFVDGERCDERVGSTNPLNAPDKLAIGRMQPGYNFFEGDIDDVRFYDRALEHREMYELMHGDAFASNMEDRIASRLGADEAAQFRQSVDTLLDLKQPVRETKQVLCVMEQGTKPDPSFIRIRGNASARGDRVEPGFPTAIDDASPGAFTPRTNGSHTTSGRRLALAEWITDPDNPLTARVMANRLWQYHFGRGLVRTPNDFGHFGDTPTHPELLDWLATELIARGWRLKSIHKLIMMSSAYRMSSRANPEALAADPTNDLFWRFDVRRLEAEEIRDSILAVNGTLNLDMHGPPVYPPMPEEVLATSSRPGQVWDESSPEDATRRSIYIHVKRSLLTPLLETFDLADTDNSCPVRFVTTQPTQALTMMNSAFLNEQARIFADRLRDEVGDEPRAQVARAIELVTQRPPLENEVDQGVVLIESLIEEEHIEPDRALTYFCLVALNLNEFVYLK